MANPLRILISRTDAIGDVVLTLPMATLLRERYPDAIIGLLGKQYTEPVIACCSAIDQLVDVADFLSASSQALRDAWNVIIHVFPRKDVAKKAYRAGIAQRIGTSSRLYHWLTCTKLIKLNRKNSDLHEAQLNLKLLAPFNISSNYSTEDLGNRYSFQNVPPLPSEFGNLLQPGKRHVILHPKSQGSAREWGLDHFAALIRLLHAAGIQIFISGTAADGQALRPLLAETVDMATDITGRMDLATFIAFINACDGLVSCSTGPLHIAAALGKVAIGLYPPIRPMHPGRWGPLGSLAIALSLPKAACTVCRTAPRGCTCISSITPLEVMGALKHLLKWEGET